MKQLLAINLRNSETGLFLVRVVTGVFLLTRGLFLFAGGWDAWREIGGVLPSSINGPFAVLYLEMWESPIILELVIWGLILLGTALIFGALTRLSALMGAIMMLLFYTADPQFGPANPQLLFFILFCFFFSLGPGTIIAVDHLLEKLSKRFPALNYLI